MFPIDLTHALAVFAVASIPMGAFGYGFSSISTPLLLLLGYTNRQFVAVLNFVELWQNPTVLAINRRELNRRVVAQAVPLSIGIVPGTVLGAYLLKTAPADAIRLATFLVAAPLILAQAAGLRRPIGRWWPLGPALGFPIGLLYGITTISGPPLALIFNNNGLVKGEFRAAMGIVRTVESAATFASYVALGIFTPGVAALAAAAAPVILASMAAGALATRYVRKEDFRRICMSFDAWIVGYGLSNTVAKLGLVQGSAAYLPFLLVVAADMALLYRYFTVQRPKMLAGELTLW